MNTAISLRLPFLLIADVRLLTILFLAALAIQSGLGVRLDEQREEDEGLEPDDVGVEPVVDGELEGDDEGRRERGQPADGPLFGYHGDDEGEQDRERRERLLQDPEPGDLGEDGPRGLAFPLEGEG